MAAEGAGQLRRGRLGGRARDTDPATRATFVAIGGWIALLLPSCFGTLGALGLSQGDGNAAVLMPLCVPMLFLPFLVRRVRGRRGGIGSAGAYL